MLERIQNGKTNQELFVWTSTTCKPDTAACKDRDEASEGTQAANAKIGRNTGQHRAVVKTDFEPDTKTEHKAANWTAERATAAKTANVSQRRNNRPPKTTTSFSMPFSLQKSF